MYKFYNHIIFKYYLIKILTIIVSSIIAIGLFRKILQIEISSTQVGLFLFHVLTVEETKQREGKRGRKNVT